MDILCRALAKIGLVQTAYRLAITVMAATRASYSKALLRCEPALLVRCEATRTYLFDEKSAPSFIQAPSVAGETAITRIYIEEHEECYGLYGQGERLCAVNLAKERP